MNLKNGIFQNINFTRSFWHIENFNSKFIPKKIVSDQLTLEWHCFQTVIFPVGQFPVPPFSFSCQTREMSMEADHHQQENSKISKSKRVRKQSRRNPSDRYNRVLFPKASPKFYAKQSRNENVIETKEMCRTQETKVFAILGFN